MSEAQEPKAEKGLSLLSDEALGRIVEAATENDEVPLKGEAMCAFCELARRSGQDPDSWNA